MHSGLLLFFFLCGFDFCFAQKTDTVKEHNFVYELPFESDRAVLVSQGYGGYFSHKNQFSIDFKLKKGTKVLAARSGEVVKVVDYHTKGGPNKKYISDGNHVVVRHEDGTYASYWHLNPQSAQVVKGQKVIQGQWIACSGNTGFSTMPHLHFDVYYYNQEGKSTTVPTQFYTSKGKEYLKVYRKYKKPI